MKMASIVGARPQFIKCGPVSREIRKVAHEVIIHTGQHYDDSLSQVFFRDLRLPEPDYYLGVGSGRHGQQTADMLKKIEEILLAERPDCALVYGDTNSTLAAALAAAKLHIPVAHVEAGLRSFNRRMPEETNRVITDHVSDWLLCPTESAVKNLEREGITRGVHLVGDVMYDALLEYVEVASKTSTILDDLGVKPRQFLLATVHRAENTDRPQNLQGIWNAFLRLAECGETVVFPVHPRTQQQLRNSVMNDTSRLRLIDPVPYLDMMHLEQIARAILTDSGGVQKEAYWLGTPCITLRDETEWIETVESRWNVLVGAEPVRIIAAAGHAKAGHDAPWQWAKGHASREIATILTYRQFPQFQSGNTGPQRHGSLMSALSRFPAEDGQLRSVSEMCLENSRPPQLMA
jgi:UDP-N-acetylglucosamine 2-epimerase